MIQIAFEPAFDPFHSAFRILRQLEYRPGVAISLSRIKVTDVYIAEPRRCLDIRLPRALKRAAELAAACQTPTYGKRPSTGAYFNRMSPMQDAAIQTLVIHGLLDSEAFSQGHGKRTAMSLPDALTVRIVAVNEVQNPLMRFLMDKLEEFPFDGPGGLKDRTNLGEFRYDIV